MRPGAADDRPPGRRRHRHEHLRRATSDDAGRELYLVTLAGPGTAGRSAGQPVAAFRAAERVAQDRTLARVGASAPVYRWTTALNGYAVRLSAAQARDLATDPAVVRVERDAVRRLAGRPATGGLGADDLPQVGGAGVVIGMVDTGLWPDSPLFADVRGLGRAPRDFRGRCATGPGWDAELCDRKIVGRALVRAGFRCRPGALQRQPVAPRRRRPRHPDGLDRGRQRRASA